ncbi:pirin family protein [Marinobacter lacisalsi]|uniref:Pirin family protein n=1 Tax=Marinobacter lacisalsi TaxID=475979 RepID=A0ABV8QLF8_9GAMM
MKDLAPTSAVTESDVVSPTALEVGSGFSARQFRHSQFSGLMDPLLMVDDYTMTEPTFGAHAHGGISAVSLLFEDSQGDFFNQDSLGNNLALGAGDLYWLSAGRGAMHDESPRSGEARIRGLQIFVKLPAQRAYMPPESLHVPGASMPTIMGPGTRVRVALGSSNGMEGKSGTPNPLTLLDGYLDGGAHFSHEVAAGGSVWIYAVEGELTVQFNGETRRVQGGNALALRTDAEASNITLNAVRTTHFVLIAAKPLDEPFEQKGPFAFATAKENEQAVADAQAGVFGDIATLRESA